MLTRREKYKGFWARRQGSKKKRKQSAALKRKNWVRGLPEKTFGQGTAEKAIKKKKKEGRRSPPAGVPWLLRNEKQGSTSSPKTAIEKGSSNVRTKLKVPKVLGRGDL